MILIMPLQQKIFEFFQNMGIHVMRKHFYSPVPDTEVLKSKRDLWEKGSAMAGVDLNLSVQMNFLERVFPQYEKECRFPVSKTSVPYEYYIRNGAFGLISASVLHSMIRHFKPSTIIEVGSGNSTYVAARAALMNASEGHPTQLMAVEPYPNPVLRKGFPGLSKLVEKKIEDLGLEFFSQLGDTDMLVIDSSHVVRIGGDVNFIYLELLPRLKRGVVVHSHDIFFPKDYPEAWVIGMRRFWTEQYLLQAFLTYNNQFEVLWCASYMYLKHGEKLRSVFPPLLGAGVSHNYFSSSFWMRRVG